MTVTSASFAIRNLTQVEVLNIKTKRHILAVLKPSLDEINSVNPKSASTVSYPEITYPLAPLPTASNNRLITGANRLQETKPTTNSDNDLPGSELSGEPLESAAGTATVPLNVPSEGVPLKRDERSFVEQPQLGSSLLQNPSRSRDVRASRTFAILKMSEPGQNPWDLGSPLLNWETVMGTSIIDWLLPIKRSPCCSHEDSESHFFIGPAVDRLRADNSLIGREDIRKRGGRKRPDNRISEPSWRNRHQVSDRPINTTELQDLHV